LKTLTLLIAVLLFPVSLLAQTNDSNFSASKALYIPSEKIIFYKLGDRQVPIRVIQYGNSKHIVCINLHDNEFTSVQAARTVLEETGGLLIKLDNKQQRVVRFRLKGIVYGIDPNRMFSRVGIEHSLRENGRISRDAMEEVEKFARRVLELIPENPSCIIALHNNTEDAYSVKSYLPGGKKERDAREVYADSLQDVDDIIYTTDSMLYRKMADHGFNSIWQDNEKAEKDGSLSVYFGERNKRYINIETQHGKVSQYVKMFQKLMEILSAETDQTVEKGENPQ